MAIKPGIKSLANNHLVKLDFKTSNHRFGRINEKN
jgi:hypothetical protein